ncbi:L,D-transpeptidase [Gaoshiqia sediminis]|uniref:L,D-transpeptidase n=1 Tax=Gaoshiqia sediminis TaxID=2986998 RepID=A0AA41YDH7_9BACT|nr:L,D-transpeptidase [Gaoshiqia sediminis]MCW0483387.1 L,D-transpeptidase [Gaoshiqia sediminis]
MMEEETGSIKKDPGLPAAKTRKGRIAFWLILAGAMLLFAWWMLVAVPWLKNSNLIFAKEEKEEQPVGQEIADLKDLKADIGRLQKKIDRMTPGGVYLIVNTSDNTFFLYKDKKLIRNGLCSTGSYVKLELNDEKNWVFETPKGVFTIKGKITSPVWRKPDWAFVEEGLPVPSANDPSRYEYGVLGDYALSLGSGYLIHGTLYKRFLGQPVTHGCIRMNDEDLEAVYQTLPIGAKVFIY